MYDAVLIEGDNERAQRVGARFALPIAIIVTIIAAILGGPSIPYNAIGWTLPYYTFPIIFGCLAYLLTLYIIYNSMRETTYVKDILKGRAFSARSLIVLLEKEDQLQKVVVAFRHLLELMKTWNEDARHHHQARRGAAASAHRAAACGRLTSSATPSKAAATRPSCATCTTLCTQYAEGAEEKRDDLCAAVVAHALDLSPDDVVPPVARAAWQLCQALLAYEGHLHVPDLDPSRAARHGRDVGAEGRTRACAPTLRGTADGRADRERARLRGEEPQRRRALFRRR